MRFCHRISRGLISCRDLAACRVLAAGSALERFRWCREAYHVPRILLAGLLAVAATFKVLAVEEGEFGDGATGLETPGIQFVLACGEFALASWLLLASGTQPARSWQVAFSTFVSFSVVSLYQAVHGEPCGCFGAIPVSASGTFALDLVLLGMMLFCRPAWVTSQPTPSRWRTSVALAVSAAIWALSAGVILAWRPVTLHSLGEFDERPQRIMISPGGDWTGRPFPLLDHLDDSERIAQGQWLVLLFSSGCDSCQRLVEGFDRLAKQFRGSRVDLPRAAIADVAAPSTIQMPREPSFVQLQIDATRHWKISRPCVVMLSNGMVQHVFQKPLDFQLIHKIWLE